MSLHYTFQWNKIPFLNFLNKIIKSTSHLRYRKYPISLIEPCPLQTLIPPHIHVTDRRRVVAASKISVRSQDKGQISFTLSIFDTCVPHKELPPIWSHLIPTQKPRLKAVSPRRRNCNRPCRSGEQHHDRSWGCGRSEPCGDAGARLLQQHSCVLKARSSSPWATGALVVTGLPEECQCHCRNG